MAKRDDLVGRLTELLPEERRCFDAPHFRPRWTDVLFRLGRTVQEMKKTTAPSASSSSASKIGFRLGRTLREGLKKWRSP